MTVFKASQMVALHNTPEHTERETNTHTKLKAYKMLMKDENTSMFLSSFYYCFQSVGT